MTVEMETGGDAGDSTESRKAEIEPLLNESLVNGEVWYLLDAKWFKLFKRHIGLEKVPLSNSEDFHPGPIDNTQLFGPDLETLRPHLLDELDYTLVNEQTWQKLLAWYTLKDNQKPICRRVIEHGIFVKVPKVEVYLMDLHLVKYDENGEPTNPPIDRQFSKISTVKDLETIMREIFQVPPSKEIRLWCKFANRYEKLGNPDSMLKDEGMYSDQTVVMEIRNADGSWPKPAKGYSYGCSPSGLASPSTSFGGISSGPLSPGAPTSPLALPAPPMESTFNFSSSYGTSSGQRTLTPGLCGLSNLGNTCFMNSALQCMSNTVPLTNYFLADYHIQEINETNPLGMKGRIASSYGDLMHQIWSGHNSSVAPRAFKMVVGQFAPQFCGFQQHDSQELLAFLLDGLHEDLNRIKKKPYVEVKDADGRPDEEVAEEAWANHLKRNDSVIVDMFHGLFKSTLVCPECSKVSVTFDPYCFLSLPLPVKKERTLDVSLFRLDAKTAPEQYKLTVEANGNVSTLCQALSKLSHVATENMVVVDVYCHKIHRQFGHLEQLSVVCDKDEICVHEMAPGLSETSCSIRFLPVYFREKKTISHAGVSTGTQFFSRPLFLSVPRRKITYDELYTLLLKRISRVLKNQDQLKEEDDEAVVNGNDGKSDQDDMEDFDATGAKTKANPVKTKPKPPRLFQVSIIAANGITEVIQIQDDDQPFALPITSCTIAVDFTPKQKNMFFDKIQDEKVTRHISCDTPLKPKKTICLDECIESFLKKEKLSVNNTWYCPSCKKHQQATKKFDLWKLPHMLVVHLKRFSYSTYRRDKLDVMVDFQREGLEFSRFLINRRAGCQIYDLIGVVNHYGNLGGGHYTAYAKNKFDNRWHYFDDGMVSAAEEANVQTKAAYVLFYQRRERSPPIFGPPDLMPVDGEGVLAEDRVLTAEENDMQAIDEDEDGTESMELH